MHKEGRAEHRELSRNKKIKLKNTTSTDDVEDQLCPSN
jgi:hypothetical protein